ncbi:MAG: hypothetical protein OXS29_00745 [bacterium]|nr:hypothetical protein [bacterium]MDE0288254.1 hypothetical protein [bacterium]MDE0438266.1 hypothetical protein [bacterium]
MNRTVSNLVLGVALVAVVASCHEGETIGLPSWISGVTPSASLPCDNAVVDLSAAPGVDPWDVAGNPDLQIIGEVAALRADGWNQPAVSASHALDSEHPGDPAFLLAPKTPLFVRRGAAFELRIADGYRDRAAVRFGSSGPASALAVGPCDSEREWILFTGRFLLTEPECLTLEVVLQDGRIEPFRIGIGIPCS